MIHFLLHVKNILVKSWRFFCCFYFAQPLKLSMRSTSIFADLIVHNLWSLMGDRVVVGGWGCIFQSFHPCIELHITCHSSSCSQMLHRTIFTKLDGLLTHWPKETQQKKSWDPIQTPAASHTGLLVIPGSCTGETDPLQTQALALLHAPTHQPPFLSAAL